MTEMGSAVYGNWNGQLRSSGDGEKFALKKVSSVESLSGDKIKAEVYQDYWRVKRRIETYFDQEA